MRMPHRQVLKSISQAVSALLAGNRHLGICFSARIYRTEQLECLPKPMADALVLASSKHRRVSTAEATTVWFKLHLS